MHTSSSLGLRPTRSSQLPWHTNLKELEAWFSQKGLMKDGGRENLHMDRQVAVTGTRRGKSPLKTWDFRTKPKVVEDPKQQWSHLAFAMFDSYTSHVCNKYYSCNTDFQDTRTDAFLAAT